MSDTCAYCGRPAECTSVTRERMCIQCVFDSEEYAKHFDSHDNLPPRDEPKTDETVQDSFI